MKQEEIPKKRILSIVKGGGNRVITKNLKFIGFDYPPTYLLGDLLQRRV